MTVLSIEEFDAQCSMAVDSSQKVYRGKTIVGGPVFPLTDVEAAQSYCEIFSQKNYETCLIVKDKNFLRIWIEDRTLKEPKESLNSQSSSETEQTSNGSVLPVEAEFVNNCQESLAQYIGPIARVVCKKTLAKKPNLTPIEFIEILAKKISDPQQAQEFKRQFLE